MALCFRQDYKVTWSAESPDGIYRLVCWDGEWNVFLDKKHIGIVDSFSEGLEFIGSYHPDNIASCCEDEQCSSCCEDEQCSSCCEDEQCSCKCCG